MKPAKNDANLVEVHTTNDRDSALSLLNYLAEQGFSSSMDTFYVVAVRQDERRDAQNAIFLRALRRKDGRQ